MPPKTRINIFKIAFYFEMDPPLTTCRLPKSKKTLKLRRTSVNYIPFVILWLYLSQDVYEYNKQESVKGKTSL